jgi:hypothetical protein
MIKLRIVDLPPEAEQLAKKIEDTLAAMVGHAVDSMITPGKGKTLHIDVSEGQIRQINSAYKQMGGKKILEIFAHEIYQTLSEQGAGVPFQAPKVQSARRAAVYRPRSRGMYDKILEKIRGIPVVGKKIWTVLSGAQISNAGYEAYKAGGLSGLKDYIISSKILEDIFWVSDVKWAVGLVMDYVDGASKITIKILKKLKGALDEQDERGKSRDELDFGIQGEF